MVRTITADERTEYVNEQIARVIDDEDVDADAGDAVVIGNDEDAYVTATITFDPETTTREVARVRRSLPMSFDREISFRGGDTLTLRVESGRSE